MAFDPLSLGLNFLPSIIGQQQIGPAAPDLRSLLRKGGLSELAQGNNFGQPLSLPPGLDPTQPLESAITPPASAQLGPPQLSGPPTEENDPLAQQGGFSGGLNNFFGNLDENLQSPSKILGLGLLNRLDPKLGLAGLLGGGLFGNQKVF